MRIFWAGGGAEEISRPSESLRADLLKTAPSYLPQMPFGTFRGEVKLMRDKGKITLISQEIQKNREIQGSRGAAIWLVSGWGMSIIINGGE
jgi:hypothetical protein